MSADMNVTEASFAAEVTKSTVPVIVDFWAPWCGPCKQLAPVLDGVAEKYVGRVKVRKINVDDEPALAGKFGIRSIPTLIFFKNGTEISRTSGLLPQNEIENHVAKII